MNSTFKDFAPISQISTDTLLERGKANNYKDCMWTSDIRVELPIFKQKTGFASIEPNTVMDIFEKTVKEHSKEESLFFEKKGKWHSLTWAQYHKEVINFSKALINLGISPSKSVNVLGSNSPQWFSAFIGAIYAGLVPCGIYPTNNTETCCYIAQHSECGCLVVDSIEQFNKYKDNLMKLKELKAIVIYNIEDAAMIKPLVNPYVAIYAWEDFIKIGKQANVDLELNNRISNQKPGNCCNIVYTSGTTGYPKAVLLSHDNITWTTKCVKENQTIYKQDETERIVSYLPLSHIAGQIFDIFLSMTTATQVYFAKPDALKGTLLDTLKFVRPTVFFAVPQIYEKFEERIRATINNSNYFKKSIVKYFQKVGIKYTDNIHKNGNKPFLYPLANYILFKKVRKAIGLDQCKLFAFGAAPMKKKTLDFFKSLGIPIYNNYGMSESTGPHFTNLGSSIIDLMTVGMPLMGLEGKIMNPDKDGVGEICFRGRNRFMGYLKNEAATQETIDNDGYLHSGDLGYINKEGNLIITGRLKELLVTAGGENVAPLPIEEAIKENCKIISHIVVVGDNKKYLSALITLKTDDKGNLTDESLKISKEIGSDALNVLEAMECGKIKQYINQAIEEANKKAASRAQTVRKWAILPSDFSIESGEITPTMKLKRKFISQKYSKRIEQMYTDPKF